STGETGYGAPPELAGVIRTSNGFELNGSAPPRVKVRVATPQGQAAFATADADGAWRLAVPVAAAPRPFGVSAASQGRVVQAQGYLFLGPDGASARLRAGGGSERLAPAPQDLAATALDWDKALAATVSGQAAPGQAVTVRVDGIARAQTSVDASG